MSESMIERVAAALFDMDYNGPFGSATARMLFGRDRITYAEVSKGVEDGVYAESALSDSRKKARAAIEAMPGWRDIKTAPKDGTAVLLNCMHDGVVIAKWEEGWEDGRCWRNEPGGWPQDPTHWMPLPPPPSEAEGGR